VCGPAVITRTELVWPARILKRAPWYTIRSVVKDTAPPGARSMVAAGAVAGAAKVSARVARIESSPTGSCAGSAANRVTSLLGGLIPWARKPACAKASSWSDSWATAAGPGGSQNSAGWGVGHRLPALEQPLLGGHDRVHRRARRVTVLEQRGHRLGQRVVGGLGLRVGQRAHRTGARRATQSYSSEPRPSASLSRKLFGRISVQFCSM
jgi:hypothetical protein